nr:hypothetical protein [bacterium]
VAETKKTLLTEVNDMIPESLVSNPPGTLLAYSRKRAIGGYLDVPAIKEPSDVAVIYTYDVAKGEEQPVFDFREGDWLRYRNPGIKPKMSHSGKRIAALSYDIDDDNVMRDLDEFMNIGAQYFGPAAKLDDSLREQAEARLREILDSAHIRPLLRAQGIEPAADRKVSDLDLEAARALRRKYIAPQWALLISGAGEPKLIELQLPAKYSLNSLTLLAVGDKTVLLETTGKSTNGNPLVQLLRVDEATGEATEFASYIGVPSSIMLDTQEQNLLLTYLRYDQPTHTLTNTLQLRTIPLADPQAVTETVKFEAVPDSFALSNDGRSYAAQSAGDHALYVAVPGGDPVKVAELLAPVDGLFVSNDGKHVAYTENGLLFAIEVVPNPEQSKQWQGADVFNSYETLAREFLMQLGYQLPAELTAKWEESDGLGLHEATGALRGKGEAEDQGVLLRYNIEQKRFESIFFPGTPWPNSKLVEVAVDAPEAEARALALRNAAGWLSDEAEKYQPGANPLFDGSTETYVLVFRDGYLVKTPKGEKVAVNGEATIRVHKPTGQVVELNLQTMPETKGSFTATDEEIAFAVRNKGNEKYPENAPIRIDTENMGLIVARNKKTVYVPARLELSTDWRLAWSVNTYIQPEDELIATSWIDVEKPADILGQLNFLPTNQANMTGL